MQSVASGCKKLWLKVPCHLIWECDGICCYIFTESKWYTCSLQLTNSRDVINRSNKTPTWCNTVQFLFLQSHSTCFGCQAPIIRSIKKLAWQTLVQVFCKIYNILTLTCWLGWVFWCGLYKTCTMLHQVGVLFDLYYNARKHKSKIKQRCESISISVGS